MPSIRARKVAGILTIAFGGYLIVSAFKEMLGLGGIPPLTPGQMFNNTGGATIVTFNPPLLGTGGRMSEAQLIYYLFGGALVLVGVHLVRG